MPKPNLSAMSIDALVKLREDINQILDRKANELRNQLSMLDGGVAARPKGSLKGKKVPPKYRSPSGETWAGRGQTTVVGCGVEARKEDRSVLDR